MPMISQPDACAIDSTRRTPGISGWPGKCPSKIVLVCGTCACAVMVRPTRSSSMIRKYSSRMAGGLSPLRRDQAVDAGAEIVENEILLGRGLAVIDLLGPLL